jgi:prevent-host-death family protein
MDTIGAFEAKNRLGELLERAANGESIVITKRGRPLAVLGPVPAPRPRDKRAVIAAIRNFRHGKTLGGISVQELVDEGRV